jgi:hypothetical protein
MTDPNPITFIQLRLPTQCIFLWEHQDRAVSTFGQFHRLPAPTAQEILALKEATIFGLLCYFTRLQLDDDGATWIGKSPSTRLAMSAQLLHSPASTSGALQAGRD